MEANIEWIGKSITRVWEEKIFQPLLHNEKWQLRFIILLTWLGNKLAQKIELDSVVTPTKVSDA